MNTRTSMMKRTFDLITAVCAVVVLSPVLAIVATAIKLDSRGPVFCRAYRVGMHGREFRLCKFRTMIRNSQIHGPSGTSGDPSVTRIGRLLRRWRIDDLPLLLNVITGEMSLVGPRPEDPTDVGHYTKEQTRILDFRPGIMSPASVARRDEGKPPHAGSLLPRYAQTLQPAKLAIDLPYFEHETFAGDIAVIGRTMAAVVGGSPLSFRPTVTFVSTRVSWLLVDAPIVAIGFYTALLLRFLDNSQEDHMSYIATLNLLLVPVMAIYAGVNHLWRLQRRMWRYASGPEVVAIFLACGSSTVIMALADLLIGQAHNRPLPLSVVVLGGFFTFTGMVVARYRWRLITGLWRRRRGVRQRTRAVIYGAGDSGQLLARRLLTEAAGAEHELVGFIDDDPAKQGLRIHNIPVLGMRCHLEQIVEEKAADLIIIAMSNIPGEQLRTVVSSAQRTSAQIRIVPDWLESIGIASPAPLVREIRVDDLLGRQSVMVDVHACARVLSDNVVLVTGGSGSVGSELCRQIVPFAPRRLLVLDNNESALYDLEIELRALCPNLDITSLVADVTDDRKMDSLFREMRPQIVFHAAAYKHVPLMQRYPEEAVRVNVGGTLVTLAKSRMYRAERFVLVSTDKAVNAESVMGATKRVAELLVLDAQRRSENEHRVAGAEGLRCTAVRFGNVLGSRGSVVPTFAKQIEAGGPVTVTHPEMTRYFMDISEAAALIIQASALTEGSEIFMLDMGERIRVDDLARKMIRLRGLRPESDIPIVYVGIRPGEKLHEELTFPEEEREGTPHHRIYRIMPGSAESSPHLYNAVQTLVAMAASGGREQLIHELMTLGRRSINEAFAGHAGQEVTTAPGPSSADQQTQVVTGPRSLVRVDTRQN